jgi:hypothetical protein
MYTRNCGWRSASGPLARSARSHPGLALARLVEQELLKVRLRLLQFRLHVHQRLVRLRGEPVVFDGRGYCSVSRAFGSTWIRRSALARVLMALARRVWRIPGSRP